MEVPDLTKDDFALTGLMMWGEGGSPAMPASETIFRPFTAGDPAARRFHRGETVKYAFAVVRAKKPAESVAVAVKIAPDGKDIFAGEPRPVQADETVEGWYKLDPALEPGEYLLGVEARKPGQKSAGVTQWIDFEVQ